MPPYADVLKWEHLPFPKSLPSFQKLFPDDAACASYLERVRWEKGFVCPLCDAKGEPYRFTARPGVKVKIAIEIQAELATGFEDGLQRAVKENCDVLRFKNAEFEGGE